MAKRDEIIQKLGAILPGDAIRMDESFRSGVIFFAAVPASKLREAMKACEVAGFFLETITGLDFQDTLEVVYHLSCYEPRSRFSLRVLCGHDQLLPTVSDVFPCAVWLEREVHDFYGIRFVDSPDLRPLFLPEDADYHPLRKTFSSVHAYHKREEIYGSAI